MYAPTNDNWMKNLWDSFTSLTYGINRSINLENYICENCVKYDVK